MGRRREHAEPAAPSLIDPEAKEKLEIAASAAGLTLAQLVDLVHDSGALTAPVDTVDGITSQITLGDLGKRMHGELQRVMHEDRTKWFHNLLEAQQIALVVTLIDEGHRPEIVARELGMPSTRIRATYDQYADRIGSQVTQIRLSTIAGHVQLRAEQAMEGLRAQGDWKGYFSVQRDVVKILQSLGIVDQAIHRVEVTHKLEDNKQAEIDALLELERKQERRKLEISNANGERLDPVPRLQFEQEP